MPILSGGNNTSPIEGGDSVGVGGCDWKIPTNLLHSTLLSAIIPTAFQLKILSEMTMATKKSIHDFNNAVVNLNVIDKSYIYRPALGEYSLEKELSGQIEFLIDMFSVD